MSLTVKQILDQKITQELANCYGAEDKANGLLMRANIERSHLKPFASMSPKDWWNHVCDELEKGLGSIETLLNSASDDYPSNPKFKYSEEEDSDTQSVSGGVDTEKDSVLALLDTTRRLANQELWAGVMLKDFNTITPKVTVTEFPFPLDIPDKIEDNSSESQSTDITTRNISNPPECGWFIFNFFNHDWVTLGWVNKTNICKQVQDEASTPKFPSILFLTGDAGIGKTASLRVTASLWVDSNQKMLLLYAPLTEVLKVVVDENIYEFEKNLEKYLMTNYDGLTETGLMDDVDDCRFDSVVLVLDSFDEAAFRLGQTRLNILTWILDYCNRRSAYFTRSCLPGKSCFLGDSKFRGILIASRNPPNYAENQILGGNITVVNLVEFKEPDVDFWLKTFNEKAKRNKGGRKKPLSKTLEANYFFSDENNEKNNYKILKNVVTIPLYLYLLASSCAVAPSSASSIVRDLIIKMEGASELEIDNLATFEIIKTYIRNVNNNSFFNELVFNQHYRKQANESIDSNKLDAVLSTLGSIAAKSDARQVSFEGMIEGLDADAVQDWAVRALPFEQASEKNIKVWRFPHLSLVEFIVAERLVDKFAKVKNPVPLPGESPTNWWENHPEIHEVTIEAGNIIMSDRTFYYVEQHLAKKMDTKAINIVKSIAEAWASLSASIVPVTLDEIKKLAQSEQPSPAAIYIVTARRYDLGLRVENLGLPLLGACARSSSRSQASENSGSLGDNNHLYSLPGSGDINVRYRFRQYLRLQSFLMDNEFSTRSDVTRLPLNGFKAESSSMEGVDMGGVNLNKGRILKSELQQAYLFGAKLRGTHIDAECNLKDTILMGADLSNAHLYEGLQLNGVSLYKAILKSATINKVKFIYCNIVNGMLQEAKLEQAEFNKCAMMYVDMRGAFLNGVKFIESNFVGAKFGFIEIENNKTKKMEKVITDLSSAEITGGVWIEANFSEANLSSTVIKEGVWRWANFDGANLLGAKITGGIWIDTVFEGAKFDSETCFDQPIGLPKECIRLLEKAGAKYFAPEKERAKDAYDAQQSKRQNEDGVSSFPS